MTPEEEKQKISEAISKEVFDLRGKFKQLDSGKISEADLKTYEERMKAELKPQFDKLQKAANAALGAYEETQKAIAQMKLESKKIGVTDVVAANAKADVYCMVNGIDNPITGTKWGQICAQSNNFSMKNPMAGYEVPEGIPLEMQLKYLPGDIQKKLFASMHPETKGDFISTDTLPAAHYYMLHEMEHGVRARLYETNPIFPFVSTQTISGDSWGYLEETGDATAEGRLERGAPKRTKIQDAKEYKLAVHAQSVFVPFTVKSQMKSGIVDPQSYIIEKGTEKINRLYSFLHWIGNGIDAPEGILSRDVGRGGEVPLIYTGVADNLFADFEGFFGVIGELSQPYRARVLKWFCHFDTIIKLWRYKREDGTFYITEANPLKLRGYDIVEMPGIPTVEAGAIAMLFGDLKGYTRLISNYSHMIRDEVTQPGWVKIYLEREEGGGITDPYSMVHVKVGVEP